MIVHQSNNLTLRGFLLNFALFSKVAMALKLDAKPNKCEVH